MNLVFNMDNGKVLGFRGDIAVRDAEVVSEGDPKTIMGRFNGCSAAICQPVIIMLKMLHVCIRCGVFQTMYQGFDIERFRRDRWILQYYFSGLQKRMIFTLAMMKIYV